MKSFDEFGLENCKLVLIAEYPCQNRKQLEKKEGGYIILKMIRTVLTDVLLVGLEWKIAAPQESITFNSKKNIRIENIENTKKKTNGIMRTIKIKYKKKRRNTTKMRRNIARRTQSIEKETEKHRGKHKEKDTKERKIRQMQKEEKGKNRRKNNNY